MDRATWRAVSAIFGVISVLMAVLALSHFGQTNAACGASPAAVNTLNTGGNCSFAAAGYSIGIASLAVGCVLLIGAFILTVSIPATDRADPA